MDAKYSVFVMHCQKEKSKSPTNHCKLTHVASNNTFLRWIVFRCISIHQRAPHIESVDCLEFV